MEAKNQASKVTYQKIKHQENPEVQLAYKTCTYTENTQIIKKHRKIRVPIKS